MARPLLRDVVVGLDGSAEALAALCWAAGAVEPGARLYAVHVVLPVAEFSHDPSLAGSPGILHRYERELREVWLAGVAGTIADLHPIVRDGRVASTLSAVAEEFDAEAVVVGHHHHTRFGPRFVGHVNADLIRDSTRPVIVVPDDCEPESVAAERPLVIGVGVSEGTRAAIRWALDRPSTVDLSLVHAFGHRTLFRPGGLLDVLAYHLDPGVVPGWVEEDLTAIAREVGSEAAAGVATSAGSEPAPPSGGLMVEVAAGRIGPALVEAGTRARVLVVGRGEPPFVRKHAIATYLRHALAHSTCPVVVVPVPSQNPGVTEL